MSPLVVTVRPSSASAVLVACTLVACSPARCPDTPVAAAPPVAASGTASDVSGTWLWSCCDDGETWVGVIVLTRDGTALRGAMLQDGDNHGSYLEGEVHDDRVWFARRWIGDQVLHEQFYDLKLDPARGRLSGTFSEPAFSGRSHSIHIERGFANAPRRGGPSGVTPRVHRIPMPPAPPDADAKRSPASSAECKCPVCPPVP